MRYIVREFYDDASLIEAITCAKSLKAAGRRLRLSTTAVREHAHRLGVRTKFRYGREKAPSREALMVLVAKVKSFEDLLRRTGVCEDTMLALLREYGFPKPSRVVRKGLPDDGTLRRDLWTCRRLQDLADDYGVDVTTVRNQLKRLGVPSPSKRGPVPADVLNPTTVREPGKAFPAAARAQALGMRKAGATAAQIAMELNCHVDTAHKLVAGVPKGDDAAKREEVRRLRAAGHSVRETAKLAGCTTRSVQRWTASPGPAPSRH